MLRASAITLLLTSIAAVSAVEPALLDAIFDSQDQIDRVQGRCQRSVVHLDEPEGAPQISMISFYVAQPGSFHLSVTEPEDEDRRELWLSDGTRGVHVTQIDPAIEPEVSEFAIRQDGWGFHHVTKLVLFDRGFLERNFELTARPVAGVDGLADVTAVLELVPMAAPATDDVQRISVMLDGDHRTRRIVLLDRSDNLSTVDILASDYDAPIDPAVFRWGEAE